MNTIPITNYSTNDYLPYPHSSCFTDEGRSLILGRMGQHDTSLIKHDLLTGEEVVICSIPWLEKTERSIWVDVSEKAKSLWVHVAEEANLAVTVVENSVWIYDLNQPGKSRKLFSAPVGYFLHGLPGITSKGDRVVVVAQQTGHSVGWLIDVESGEGHPFIEQNWMADHFHFCPHDENWIGFSHEGACDTVPDRMWGWHPTLAPEGKCIFNQQSDDPQHPLCVGHERWCFHETFALVVAYGESVVGPRGLYEIFPDGRPARLVSQGDRDWHCNVSRDGRWAVVDTAGPHDMPGKGWEGVNGESDIVLVEMKSGARTFLAHSRSGKGQAHPHPVFSPDGRWIYFNKVNDAGTAYRVEKVENPFSA